MPRQAWINNRAHSIMNQIFFWHNEYINVQRVVEPEHVFEKNSLCQIETLYLKLVFLIFSV